MSPQADAPCPANMNLNQEQYCSDGLLQPQTTHQGSSSLASDHFQRSYHIAAPSQLRTMEKRSTNPSSWKQKKKKKGKTNRSPATPLQAPDHPEPHTPYQDYTDPSCPTTTTFQESYGVTIYGKPDLLNNNITVNPQSNLGGSQAVENFKQFVSFEAIQDSSTRNHDIDPVIRAKTLKLSQDWMDNPNATERIAWLHGPASIGKTAIALEIARQKNVVAMFFFNKSDAIRCDGNRVFLTLAWQLAVSIPDMKDHIIRSISKYSDLPQKSIEEQYEYLIAQPFAAMKKVTSTERPSGLVVVIDGIDECADMGLRRRILKVIGKATLDHRVPLRFIICSRPSARTRFIFGQLQCPVFSIDLAEFQAEVRKRGERIRMGGEGQDEELMEQEEEPEKSEAFRLLLLLLISLFVRTRGEELERKEEEPMGREEELAKPFRLLLFLLISPIVFLVFLLPVLLCFLFFFFPLFLFFFALRLLSSFSSFVLRLPSFLVFFVLRLLSSLLFFFLWLLAPLLFFVLRLLASLLFSLSFLLASLSFLISSLSSLFSSLSSLLSSLPVLLSSLDPPVFNLLLVTIIVIPILAATVASNGNARRHTF